MFQNVDAYAGDPILSLMEAFQQDPRADKVNLSIGLYYNEQAIIPQLEAVRQAADRLQSQQQKASLYLPMEGLAPYRRAVQTLLFGDNHPALRAGRIATIQTLGGSGALKVGADFLKRYFPDSAVWVSDPTWENHVAIFAGAGFEVHTYPWFDRATRGVNFPAMLAALQQLPPRSIVLLHPCCHNPTGADLTREQWDRVIEVLIGRELIPFLDIAYQGFGRGLDEDAYAIRAIASAGLTALVSNSFSKIFSLYGERVGGLYRRARAGPVESHRAPQLLQPAGVWRPGGVAGAQRSRAECPVAGRSGGHAHPHQRHARRAGEGPAGSPAGGGFFLSADPARHVQLHRL